MNYKNFLNILVRKTSGHRFVPEIDGLRFLAIITVLIFHLNTAYSREIGVNWLQQEGAGSPLDLGWWLVRMDLGVKVFFAISGFILALPFLNQYWLGGRKVVIKDYLLRRLTRLEPPYILTLLLFFFAQGFVYGESLKELFPSLLASLFYIHNFIFNQSSLINPVAWSLEVEVQFYLLIPLFAALLWKGKPRMWGVIGMVMLLIFSILSKNYIMVHKIPHIGSSILVYFSHFATGILFAPLFLLKREYLMNKSLIFDIIGLIGLFLLFYYYKPQRDIWNNIVFNAAIFITFLAAFKGTTLNRFYSTPIIYVVGGMCYTIYLIHYPLYHVLVKLTSKWTFFEHYFANLALQMAILLPVVIGISAVFFKLFEQPFMDKDWPVKFKKWIVLKRKKFI
jgi:peptidoglycan/LPS O-acetylase OafA/YrhL